MVDATAAVRPLNDSCELYLVLWPTVKACATESVVVEIVLYLIFTKIFHLNTTVQPTNPLG